MGETVYVKNFSTGRRWLPGTIRKVTSLSSRSAQISEHDEPVQRSRDTVDMPFPTDPQPEVPLQDPDPPEIQEPSGVTGSSGESDLLCKELLPLAISSFSLSLDSGKVIRFDIIC